MKLNEFDEHGKGPDYDALWNIVLSYRSFTGLKASFHIEYPWWRGQFESKEEEMEFFLNEYSRPDDYEVVDQWHEDAVKELSATEIELSDVRSSRYFWRIAAIVLTIPYLAVWHFLKA